MKASGETSRSRERKRVPRVWLDADTSGLVWTGLDCDDDLAVLVALALQARGLIRLEGISVVGGNAPLRHTWPDMLVLLQHAGSQLSPVKGYGWRSMQLSRTWLKWLDFIHPDVEDSNDAAQAIIDASHAVDNLTILTLGPLTNVARAIEQDPTLISRIDRIVVMGGELTQRRLCLNFDSDRAAAQVVLDANVKTTLIPIQLGAQISIGASFVDSMEQHYCQSRNQKAAACALLPKMRQQVKAMPNLVNKAVAHCFPSSGRWNPSSNLDSGFIPWDIVAVLAISHPELLDQWEYHMASIPTCSHKGSCDQSGFDPFMTVKDLPSHTTIRNHSGVVSMPHLVQNETEVLHVVHDLLGATKATQPNDPELMWGFLAPLIVLGATICVLMAVLRAGVCR